MRFKTLSTIAFSATLAACALAQDGRIVKGPAISVGKGKAWTWVKLVDDKPVATGLSFTEKAITDLPTDLPAPPAMPGMAAPMPSEEWVLQFPKEIKGLPYDHLGFDWNPKGHDPMQFYGVPHFDVHFYVISVNDRKAITAMGDDLDRCNKKPDETFVPAGYICPPGTIVPNMGTHWVDPMTPELHGSPFTSTFIYGSYNGKTAFYEPMIALSYLQTKPNFSQDLKMPKGYDLDGYYPSNYSISFDSKHHEYSVALNNLTMSRATVVQAATAASTTNGLVIEDVKTGDGDAAQAGDWVTVNYTGTFTDGKVFDSSLGEGRTPFTFHLGAGQVIKGWDQGVVGMKKGGVRKLTIPPELAYGTRGAGGVIPPNSTLIFTVECISISKTQPAGGN